MYCRVGGLFLLCAYDAPSDAPIAINLIAVNSLFSRCARLFTLLLVGFGVEPQYAVGVERLKGLFGLLARGDDDDVAQSEPVQRLKRRHFVFRRRGDVGHEEGAHGSGRALDWT